MLSSDYCRGLVSDNENEQSATVDAFEVLHFIAAKRLARARLTVIDATNVQAEARAPLVHLARQYHCLPVALVFDLPEKICHERNRNRNDRTFGPHVIRRRGHNREPVNQGESSGRGFDTFSSWKILRKSEPPLLKECHCGMIAPANMAHSIFLEICTAVLMNWNSC